ncbi:hypothetical protein [Burkholderia metallica]|uniref:hypothetical protein n=1 Tax=Burkholderia metallica TaxID=488729 RepID=UPI001576D8D9|nr:hypothetical protein [Burkholderia metallica]NTZ04288.1 hypothetical protein [Burkholderia metallica]
MTFTPDFLSLVTRCGTVARYYAICAEHPLRLEERPSIVRATEIVAAARDRMSLSKLPGPGTVLQLHELSPGVMLRFILQGRRSVETDFSIQFGAGMERGTLAVLSHAAALHSGAEPHRPPYPRPEFHSADELLVIFQKLGRLVNDIAKQQEARS